MRLYFVIAPLLCGLASLAGCQQDPDLTNKEALKIGAPLQNAAEIRASETDVFAVRSERRLLIEATQVLQDLGFTIEESAPRYGVLAGSKNRDATETGQVAGQIALMVGLALLGVEYSPTWDQDQIIRATLTTRPVGPHEVSLRVSFERIVTTNQGISRAELLTGSMFSRGFFDRIRSGLDRPGA